MEGNYSCSFCPQVAVRCCLCSSPRTYLCKDCVLHHTSKSSSHPLVPIDTPPYVTKENLVSYDRRATALKQLKEQLEGLNTQLTQEKRALDQVFEEVYNSQAQRLYEICSAVYMDISGYYDRLQSEVETFKQGLESASVSQVLRKYVENGFHIPQPCAFLDARSQMTQRIQISEAGSPLCSENCLVGAIRIWNKRVCSCSNCEELKRVALAECLYCGQTARQCLCNQPKGPGPQPAQADAPMQVDSGDAYYGASPSGASEAPWRCQNCGQENSAQVARCQSCQWVPVTKCGLCGQDSEGDIC